MPQEEALDQLAREFADVFASTWNDRDGEAYGEAYWPDAELVDPTGTIWTGRAEISAMHVGLWQGPARDTRVTANVRRVEALTPTIAIVDLDVHVTGFSPPPPGAQCDAEGGVRTRLKHVIQKRDSEWKILASQNTFVADYGDRDQTS